MRSKTAIPVSFRMTTPAVALTLSDDMFVELVFLSVHDVDSSC
jgi:hypothetical protein